jgi:hypothetical protein
MAASEPFNFAKYRRPHFEGPVHNRARAAESDDGPMTEDLSDLLGRVSETSIGELIVSLVSLNSCGESYGPMVNAFNARLRNTTH